MIQRVIDKINMYMFNKLEFSWQGEGSPDKICRMYAQTTTITV